jgi:hypothetical protein
MNSGVLILVLGILVAILSLLADQFGVGKGGFGPKQIGGVALGVLLIIVGMVMRSRGRKAGGAS